ncbi:MAG: Crp/Fnr family transcriptional regulator [Rhodocyclaceae bacterium]|nr:Crp/Fnr family transcriptional regulator [Rhodocyclaceae bacterium]
MNNPAAPRINIAQTLRRLPLFSEITDEQLAMLATATHERDLARGEILFQQGDPPKGFYYVIGGQIKLAFASRQGNEKVVEVLGPNQSFGEAVLFMDRNYPVFAEALADSQLLLIDRGVVFALIEADFHFARALLAGMAIRLHGMVRDVEAYSLNTGAQRVVSYLISLGEGHAPGTSLPCSRVQGHPPMVTLPVSKHVLASRLNLVPETLSRIFHDLADRGLIHVHGSDITLTDVAGLREIRD